MSVTTLPRASEAVEGYVCCVSFAADIARMSFFFSLSFFLLPLCKKCFSVGWPLDEQCAFHRRSVCCECINMSRTVKSSVTGLVWQNLVDNFCLRLMV